MRFCAEKESECAGMANFDGHVGTKKHEEVPRTRAFDGVLPEEDGEEQEKVEEEEEVLNCCVIEALSNAAAELKVFRFFW